MTELLNILSWGHIFRSLLHVSLFVTGIFYAFSIPYFLNAEVWVYIYTLSGVFLVADTFMALQDKKNQFWPVLYALDALFVALVIYKTGHVFFNIFLSIWLFHILFVGIQYHWKGVLLQGVWTSVLWAWVQMLSIHFQPFDWKFFAFNSFLVLGFSTGWSIVSFYKNNIYSFFKPEFLKIKDYISELFRPLVSENWEIIKDKSLEDSKIEKIDMDFLMSEVTEYCHEQAQFSIIRYSSSIVGSVLGYKSQIKQMIVYMVQWFVCHYNNPYQKVNIQIFKKEDWLVIEFKKSGDLEVQQSLSLLHWMKGMMFIQNTIARHKGELKIHEDAVHIYLPISETQNHQLSS